MIEAYDDLAILECYDYRCGYCFALLPVYADVDAYRTRTHTGSPSIRVTEVCGFMRKYFGFHFDHLEPYSEDSAEEEWTNLVPCCVDCNRRKGRSSLPRWLFRQIDPGAKRISAMAVISRKKRAERDVLCAALASQDLESLLRASLEPAPSAAPAPSGTADPPQGARRRALAPIDAQARLPRVAPEMGFSGARNW